MRPLNRPMFKMGGPVKEGIMDGIREPKADGGTIGGGTIVGEDKGKGRTGYAIPLLAFAPAALGTAARFLAPRAIMGGLRAFGRGVAAKPTAAPKIEGIFNVQRLRSLLPTGRFLQPATPKGQVIPGKFQPAPLSFKEAIRSPEIIGRAVRENPITAFVGAGQIKNIPEIATGAAGLAKDIGLGGVNYLLGTEFGKEKPEDIVKKSSVGQQGKKGDDAITPKDKDATNQFNDDGTKKDTSVERLLKGVVKRARRDAGADTAIEVGRKLRTGEMSIKDPSGAIDIASEKFDKVSDLQSKVDLARIENELKKQQIKEQALATDKYIRAASATGKPVDFVARKSLGIPTSISETTAIFEKAQPGFTKTNEGTQIVAKEWADTEGINFQGSLGGDDDLKKANKIEEFKLNPESFILEKIEELDGNNGLYVFGTNVFEYNNGVVKKIKN